MPARSHVIFVALYLAGAATALGSGGVRQMSYELTDGGDDSTTTSAATEASEATSDTDTGKPDTSKGGDPDIEQMRDRHAADDKFVEKAMKDLQALLGEDHDGVAHENKETPKAAPPAKKEEEEPVDDGPLEEAVLEVEPEVLDFAKVIQHSPTPLQWFEVVGATLLGAIIVYGIHSMRYKPTRGLGTFLCCCFCPGGWVACCLPVDESAPDHHDPTEQVDAEPDTKRKSVARHIDPPQPLPEGWKAGETAEGTIYYYNEKLGLTQWDLPAESDGADGVHGPKASDAQGATQQSDNPEASQPRPSLSAQQRPSMSSQPRTSVTAQPRASQAS